MDLLKGRRKYFSKEFHKFEMKFPQQSQPKLS